MAGKITPIDGSDVSIRPASAAATRTVSADPGLLSHEELLARNSGRRRRTLEELIAKEKLSRLTSTHAQASLLFKKAKKKVLWFVDHAQIKISVRYCHRRSLCSIVTSKLFVSLHLILS